MIEITKYKATDGKEFTDRRECVDYEKLIERVNVIMSELPKPPENDSCSFVNGGGYLKHDKNTFMSVRLKLLNVCKEHITHNWVQQTIDNETVHPSFVGRLLDDYNLRPLSMAWDRIQCVDNEFREWGQPYFANNPNDAKQNQLN